MNDFKQFIESVKNDNKCVSYVEAMMNLENGNTVYCIAQLVQGVGLLVVVYRKFSSAIFPIEDG